MKKFFLLMTVLVATTSVVKAESKREESKESTQATAFSIKGIVTDTTNNEAIAGASITINGNKYYSDFSGRFNIPALKEGKHTLLIDFISYQTQALEVDLKDNQDIKIEIKQQ